MSSVVISGDTSGAITVAAPAVAGTNTITLPAVTGTVVVAGQNSAVTAATAQASTSGTSIDFTGIPSWVKRITVMFSGVSTNGTSNILVQLGDAGGFETTGYTSGSSYSGADSFSTAGYLVLFAVSASLTYSGSFQLTNVSGNVWVISGNITNSSTAVWSSSGSKTLSDTLTQVRITTVNGTDTFDAGTINILYE